MASPSDGVSNLNLAYVQICQRIADVTASAQPSYSENGRSVSKSEYLSNLIQQQTTLLQSIQQASGPFDVCG